MSKSAQIFKPKKWWENSLENLCQSWSKKSYQEIKVVSFESIEFIGAAE